MNANGDPRTAMMDDGYWMVDNPDGAFSCESLP
jgi:hypothetical protein